MAWITSAGPRGLFVSGTRGAAWRRSLASSLELYGFSSQTQILKLAAGLHLGVLAIGSPLLLSSPGLSLAFASGVLSVMVIALAGSKAEGAIQTDSIPVAADCADSALETNGAHGLGHVCEFNAQSHNTHQRDGIPGGALAFSHDPSLPENLGVAPKVAGDASTAALADLMARVSHELRTPLNAVIGFSDLMETEAFGPLGSPRYQEYSRHIRDSGKALLKSAEDTLAMTSALADPSTESDLRSVGLRTIVSEAWQFLEQDAHGKGLCLDTSNLQDVDVLSSRQSLRQIVVNLVSDAIVRAEHGATISVFGTARAERVEFQISVSACCAPRSNANDKTAEHGIGRGGALDSLAVCVARALLELQGTSLLEMHDAATGWRVITVLDRAVQDDFFTTPKISTAA